MNPTVDEETGKVKYYLLHCNTKQVVRCAKSAFQDSYRSIPRLQYVGEDEVGEVKVVTKFTGIDCRLNGAALEGADPEKPIVFETFVNGGEHNGYERFYQTWEDAEKGHAEVLEMVSE